MGSFFGRYLRVQLPELDLDYISNTDKDGIGGQAPRMIVTANLQYGSFVQGKVSIYGLSSETRKKLQQSEFTVNIWAGWSNQGNSQIITADKKFLEVVRRGEDLITNIYFFSNNTQQDADIYESANLQDVIREQATKFGYTVNFENNYLNGITLKNKTLIGNLNKRLDKLKSLYDFEYFIQSGQLTIVNEDDNSYDNVIDIDASEGLLSIPTFSNIGHKIDFAMMFNAGIRIGGLFRLTNKYTIISISDLNKTFNSVEIAKAFDNVQNTKFRIFNIDYSLDTRGKEFLIRVEGNQPLAITER